MSEQQNIDVVRQAYAAFGRGDLEGMINLLDPQVSWRTPGPPDLPTAGLRRGPAAVREFFGVLLSMFEISNFQPRQFLAQGNTVVVLGTSGEGVKGTARAVDFRWVHVNQAVDDPNVIARPHPRETLFIRRSGSGLFPAFPAGRIFENAGSPYVEVPLCRGFVISHVGAVIFATSATLWSRSWVPGVFAIVIVLSVVAVVRRERR